MHKKFISNTFRITEEHKKFIKKMSKRYEGDSAVIRALLDEAIKNYKLTNKN